MVRGRRVLTHLAAPPFYTREIISNSNIRVKEKDERTTPISYEFVRLHCYMGELRS